MRWPAVPGLSPVECQVWWAVPRPPDEAHAALLSEVEVGRRDGIRAAADRDRFTTGVVLSRLLLAGHSAADPAGLALHRTCSRCGGPHGKPTVSGDLHFSVSHSGARVVVAVTRTGPVGVDVEVLGGRDDVARIARLVLSEAERQVLDDLPPANRVRAFLRYWTRKEALVKATGEGLAVRLPALWVSAPDEPPRLLGWDGRPEMPDRMRLYDLDPGPDWLGSLAVLGGSEVDVTEHDASALLAAPVALGR